MAEQHPDNAVPLPLPRTPGTFPFFVVDLGINRELAINLLGLPHHTEHKEGLGLAEYWAFSFPCGLKICYQFFQLTDQGGVYADMPEVEHVRRHLPFPDSIQQPLDLTELKTQIDVAVATEALPREAIQELRSVQVWRQGDDGNEMPVGFPTTKRDAACWIQELESHGHKQTYWSEAVR